MTFWQIIYIVVMFGCAAAIAVFAFLIYRIGRDIERRHK